MGLIKGDIMDEKTEQMIKSLTADYSLYMGVKYGEDDFETAGFQIGESGMFYLISHGDEKIGSVLCCDGETVVTTYYTEKGAERAESAEKMVN